MLPGHCKEYYYHFPYAHGDVCAYAGLSHALQDEFEGEIPPYPYMRMRTRETFPWGTDRGLFEVHQHVHPLQ